MGDRGALAGKVALVTGATQAMGEAIAGALAGAGASVLGVGRSLERGQAVADRLVAAGLSAAFTAADVSQEDQVVAAIEAAVRQFGRIDIVVNNAAALDGGTPEAPVHEESSELFDQIMKVNLYGPFWFMKHAVSPMMDQGDGGVFLNVSSYAAHLGVGSLPAYTASKGGLEALTRQVAADYASHGIRANTLVLGSISVPRNSALHEDDDMSDALRSVRMIRRVGVPQDVAAAVAFLASDDAGYITGTTLNVDGGLLAKAPVQQVAKQLGEHTVAAAAAAESG